MSVKWARGLEKILVPIDSIQQHPDNPNNGDVQEIVDSIEVNGFNTVITVDAQTNYIIAGNHRWQALHALGAEQCPVVFVDRNTERGDIRYLIADNLIGKKAVVDDMELAGLLMGLKEQTMLGLAGTGMDDAGLERLLNDLAMMNSQLPPDGGAGGFLAPSNLYQITVTFEGDEDARNALYDELAVRFPGITKAVNL